MELLALFIPGIFALGIITSREDVISNKIRNRWIILGLGYALAVNLGILLYLYLVSQPNWIYFAEFIVNLMISAVAAFLLWHFRIWTAGDGKLFIAYAALIPLTEYIRGHYSWFPSIVLLTNIFIAGLIGITVHLIAKSGTKWLWICIREMLKDFSDLKSLLGSLLYIFSVFWLINKALSYIGGASNTLLVFMLAFLIFPYIREKAGAYAYYFLGAIAAARLFLDSSIYSFAFIQRLIIIVIVWRSLLFFFGRGIMLVNRDYFCSRINTAELRPGMILMDEAVSGNKKGRGKKGEGITFRPKGLIASGKALFSEDAEGLTAGQIAILRKSGVRSVAVARTMPFAPLIFIGALLTIIAKGNILILLRAVL